MKRGVLSARQREVLRLVAGGRSSEQIGRELGISSGTVTRHLTEAYRALGAQERAHAVALAIWGGHITLAELAAIAGQQAPQEPASARLAASQPVQAAREGRDAQRASGGRTAA